MDTAAIPLDTEAARIYMDAPAEERKRLRLLLSLWLREYAESALPLQELMDQISDRAQERGMTPEALDALLHAE